MMSGIPMKTPVSKRARALVAALIATAGAAPVRAQHAGQPTDHSQHHSQHRSHDPSRNSSPDAGHSAHGAHAADHGAGVHDSHDSHASHDSHGMDHVDHGALTTMDGGEIPATTGMAPPAPSHDDMRMQGGSAPPDARDPHAYSGGYQLGTGQYALGPTRQLHMADEHLFASLLVDRLEWTRGSDSNAASYEAQAWFGGTYNRLVVKAEGEAERGKMHEARTELLWGHAVGTFWDTQLGIRNDAGHARPARNWLAFGVQGLAPYWFEVDATAYVGTEGRTALRLAAEYELLVTQRLILQPRVEANLYGKNDPAVGVGSGLSSGAVGVRLRYEFSRQFAPYIGVERYQTFGNTADLARGAGGRSGETRFVAGVRVWF